MMVRSDPFPVTNGVKQGCVLAPTLFNMMFSAMLTGAFQDGDNGISIRYRFDGKLFNLRRLQAKSKVQVEVLDEFLFADDMAKGAPTEEKMQKGVDQVSDSCDNYGLTISIKKTEVVYQPAPGKPYKEPTITVKGQRLQVVDKCTYLGSTLSRVVHIDDEVNARIAKASAAFCRLRGSVWGRSGIRFDTKLKVYKAVVLSTLLYACETWTVYQRHAKRLNHFNTSCLRKLLKIKWQDRIPDTEVLKRVGMQSVHTLLKLAQLRWTGHVTRMPEERLPKKILYRELEMGKRSYGGQKKRYKNTRKAFLRDFNMPTESWEQIAQDRAKWPGLIRRGASEYEAKRISEAEQKRAQRKARDKASPTELSCSYLCCSICNRQFRARIDLISHLRTHSISRMWLRLVIDRRTIIIIIVSRNLVELIRILWYSEYSQCTKFYLNSIKWFVCLSKNQASETQWIFRLFDYLCWYSGTLIILSLLIEVPTIRVRIFSNVQHKNEHVGFRCIMQSSWICHKSE